MRSKEIKTEAINHGNKVVHTNTSSRPTIVIIFLVLEKNEKTREEKERNEF